MTTAPMTAPLLEIENLFCHFDGRDRRRGSELQRTRRRDQGRDRSERCRQEHAVQHDRRRPPGPAPAGSNSTANVSTIFRHSSGRGAVVARTFQNLQIFFAR